MLALRSCAYSMCTCIYAVANITIDPILLLRHPVESQIFSVESVQELM